MAIHSLARRVHSFNGSAYVFQHRQYTPIKYIPYNLCSYHNIDGCTLLVGANYLIVSMHPASRETRVSYVEAATYTTTTHASLPAI